MAVVHRRRGGRRRSGGGGGYGLKPSTDDLKLFAGAATYGWVEGAAKADQGHFLNKVPKPIEQLGFTGNTALVLWALSVFTKNPLVRVGARAVATVGAYQLGRRGKLYASGDEHFQVTGWTDDDVAEAIEEHIAGANQIAGIDPFGQPGY